MFGGFLVGPGADLTGANLTGVNLSEATLDGVISSGIIGLPVLPKLWRIVRGVLVGPPTFVVRPLPKITGTLKVGSTLTANTGTWKPTPSKFEYRWFETCSGAGGTPYLAGTAKSLKLVDPGCTVTVTVTAVKTGYQGASTTSERTSEIGLGIFTAKQVPVITGSPIAGRVLKVKCKTWSPAATITFEWFSNGVSLATGDTLLLLPTDVGSKITVRATGSTDGYVTATTTSKATSAVKLR